MEIMRDGVDAGVSCAYYLVQVKFMNKQGDKMAVTKEHTNRLINEKSPYFLQQDINEVNILLEKKDELK